VPTKTADKVIAFIERYCLIPEGSLVGQPMKLAPFQKKFIKAIYEPGVRRGYLSIARKNGKSGLVAAILLAHIDGPVAVKNSQIISGARSRDQAALVFSLAAKMVQLSPVLRDRIRIVPSGKRLIGLAMNVEYRALAADGTTAHGLSPVLAILDEVGQVRGPQDDFVDAITTSQGAHENPLLLAISTQAPTDGDLLSIWIDDARRSNDPRIVCHVYEGDKDCDVTDKAQWAKANPALNVFRSLADVQEQAEQAARMPSAESTFRNLVLNQRVQMLNPFVSRSVWEENASPPDSMDDCIVSIGLDLSAKTDLTSAVIVFEREGFYHVHPMFWAPEVGAQDRAKRDRVPYMEWVGQGFLRLTPGATVNYEHVIADIMDVTQDCIIKTVAFDRWRIDIFKQALERMDVEWPMVMHGQGFKDMSPAVDAVEAALLNRKIKHGMHPVMTMCAANAVITKDPAGNRKLDKGKANGRIDGMVALAMAMAHVDTPSEEMDLTDFLADPIRVW
jgi:phage terminase large subunit-like protein